MIWVDREAEKIAAKNPSLEWVDDMKTPSGRIHVGSLRGVIVHDLIYKVLKEKGVNVNFSYVFNDMDPMDAIPSYLDQKKWSPFAGKSLFQVPSPEAGFKSFAEFYAKEFINVFNSLNCHPQIIWSSELYKSGKMDPIIKLFLDNAEKIREIYKNIAKAEKGSNWFPYNPICEKCGRIGTTNVYKWDGEFVYYRCEYHMVDWAQGCGYEGKLKPVGLAGKLPWKLDWPAHWKVIGVTIEGSGKDHMSSGGSYDMATHFCKEILETTPPYAIPYEWFTIGGKKMSSSKGIGTSAKEVTQILPPEVFRFMLVRTPVATHLDFNPYGDTIPNLFDDYDRCLDAHFLKIEGRLPKAKAGEVLESFSRIIKLSEVKPLPEKRLYLPRFRTIANLIKSKNNNLIAYFENHKKNPLNQIEKEILEERIIYAKIYLDKYSGDKKVGTDPVFKENQLQKDFLKKLAENLRDTKNSDKDVVQKIVFDTMKEINIKPKDAFIALYQKITGKNYGPKAADLIVNTGLENTVKKLIS